MDYITEVINISKIREGFFIGDRTAGTNLDVVIQFKITHMINAAGSQIINQFESIGVKYLTLNWSETPNQSIYRRLPKNRRRFISAQRSRSGPRLFSSDNLFDAKIQLVLFKMFAIFTKQKTRH